MVTYGIVVVFVLIVALIIYFNIKGKNKDKDKSQEEIQKKPKEQENKRPSHNLKEKTKQNRIAPKKVPSAKAIREAEEKKVERQKLEQKHLDEEKIRERLLREKRLKKQKRKEEREKAELAKNQKEHDEKIKEEKLKEEKAKTESEIVSKPEASEKIDLPECKYPKFDYSRLIGMGLGEDEAMEFIKELIPQIQTQIPLIKEAIAASDFHNIERLTHSIKGSSTTVGSGGVADLLVEFNTYVKTEKSIPIIEAYLKHLEYYCNELEKEYS